MPRKKVVEGKRYPLNMRTTKEMREKLESAATNRAAPWFKEVEFRLERTFDREEISTEVSRRLNTFDKEFLARAIKELQPRINEWLKQSGAKERVSKARKGKA